MPSSNSNQLFFQLGFFCWKIRGKIVLLKAICRVTIINTFNGRRAGGGEFTVRQLQEAAVLDFWAVECTIYIEIF